MSDYASLRATTLAAITLCASVDVCDAQTRAMSPPARVDTFMVRASQHGLSGTLLVARNDSVVLLRSYGLADRATRSRLTDSTPYFLGSIGKQFTAAAILRLEADGKLSVTDSLSRFFPEARGGIAGITLAQLMSHTAGLPYLPSRGLFGEGSRDSVMREMLTEPVGFPPGSRYDYSSVGFILLAGVVERASGMSYEQFIQQRVFAPARLRSAGFIGDSAHWAHTPVRSYSDNEAEPSLAELPAFPRTVGAGSIAMTVPDLYRWYRSLLNGDVLPKASADKLFETRTQIRQGRNGGFAWTIATVPTGVLRLIAGDIGGFNAELRHYVDERFVVVFASNRRTRGVGDREIVMNNVARLMRGDSVPLPPALAQMPREVMNRLAGEYVTDHGGRLSIRVHGDSLLLGATDSGGIAELRRRPENDRAGGLPREVADQFMRLMVSSTPAIDTMVDRSLPADARASFILRLRATIVDSASSPPKLLGTFTRGPESVTFLATYPRGKPAEFASLIWSGEKITGMNLHQTLAGPELFAPEPAGTAVSYDIFNGRTLRLRVTPTPSLEIDGVSHSLRRVS